MLKTCLALLILLASPVTFAASLERKQVKTPRGATVNVAISVPDAKTSGKRPAVVLAPGAGYHMELPLMKDLAEKLAAADVIAFRFDWNYYSSNPRGQSAANLSTEVDDMQAVVSLAQSDPRVDPARIVIAGKSMGSVVAFRVFSKNPTSKALVLLTPLCSSTTDERGNPLATPKSVGSVNYPGLTDLEKPVVIELGNADPACFVPNLYDWLKGTKGNVVSIVVGGDHGLNVVSDNFEDPRNAENIAAGIQIVAHWIRMAVAK